MFHTSFATVALIPHWNSGEFHSEKKQLYPGWRLSDIQRWSAMIQKYFRSDSLLFITWKSRNSAENKIFQS